jgi:hypothetical protein
MSISSTSHHTRFDQLAAAVAGGDLSRVSAVQAALKAEYLLAHDGLRNAVARTIAEAVRIAGPVEGEAAGRRVVLGLMGDGDVPQYSQGSMMDRLDAIATGWHWHATEFSLREESDRFTFVLGPCGSGMRLIQEGAYARSDALPLSIKPSKSTFMSAGYPTYCNHCSEMAYASLRHNKASFIVEGWTPLRQHGTCLQHTFKDGFRAPDEFYRRVDLTPPEQADPTALEKDDTRLLSDEQLAWISTHPLDRIMKLLERGDTEGASELVNISLVGWRDSIHDVYRRWLALLWKEALVSFGESAWRDCVRRAEPELLMTVASKLGSGDRETWEGFWMAHLRLERVESADGNLSFVSHSDALIDPIISEDGDAASDVLELLTQGLVELGHSRLGVLTLDGTHIVHRVHES